MRTALSGLGQAPGRRPATPTDHAALAALRERVRSIESRRARPCGPTTPFTHGTGAPPAPAPPASAPPAPTRQLIDLLPFGAVHEWFADGRAPPIGVLVHAASAVYHRQDAGAGHGHDEGDQARTIPAAPSAGNACIAFIGRAVWPTIFALRAHGLLRAAMFIDPRDDVDRLWAIDLALRSPAVRVVMADGSGLDLAATRRLQLSARPAEHTSAGPGGNLALLARPARERSILSAATTRWLVEPGPPGDPHPSWRLRLLRIKGHVGIGTFEQTITALAEDDGGPSHSPATQRITR